MNGATTKISALSSSIPLQPYRIIQEAKLYFSPLGKAFEKQTKPMEKQGAKTKRSY